MDLDSVRSCFDHGSQCICPDDLPFRQQIHFIWSEEHYKKQIVDARHRYSPQFLAHRSSKDQKIWFLLNRHFQSQISHHSQSIQNSDQDVQMNISICKMDNPIEFPYMSRVSHRHTDTVCGTVCMKSHFNLLQIGLFDEEIGSINSKDPYLSPTQKSIADIQDFMKDYVGLFTIRVGLFKPLLNTKGDLRFTLFEYSNKQIEPLQRIKIHHEDEVDVDAHLQPTPMFELNSELTHKDVSVTIQRRQETKILTILHSIGITAGNRSWQQDENGEQIIQILSEAFGGKAAADAFYSVARFHLGSQIELQLTPKVGYYGRRDAYTIESVGPERYDVQTMQIKNPWQYTTHELSWDFQIKSKAGMDLNYGQASQILFIIKADKATDIHLQFIMTQLKEVNANPAIEFQVVKLGGPQLVNESAIALRLFGAAERGQWKKNNDQEMKMEDTNLATRIIYTQIYPQASGSYKPGWVMINKGSGKLDGNAYNGLCVNAGRWTGPTLTIVAFAWSNSILHLYNHASPLPEKVSSPFVYWTLSVMGPVCSKRSR
ncbi:MAG: hypothetical protein EZS28_027932 [Streblomastix strix]|uniref:Uncharacterized protein n=1 Tax=Streblomastix strix TaxID=222440 RepID=A0A5J4V2E1_9EUKA|nr:MAG: hypothetical protein EZS28_027932 [Streblomastix strix]